MDKISLVATQSTDAEPSECCEELGARNVGRFGTVILSFLTTVVSLLLLYTLWAFWPTAAVNLAPTGAAQMAPQTVHYLVWTIQIPRESLFFVVVAVAGMLGGLIHTIRSLTWYMGNRDLRRSWVPFNLMLPLIGALGGTLFYLVLRAGLFSPSTSADQASPFGFAAVAALVGLFSEQALEKLRQVATHIFAERPSGSDHVDPRR
jgi:hypothetical protein